MANNKKSDSAASRRAALRAQQEAARQKENRNKILVRVAWGVGAVVIVGLVAVMIFTLTGNRGTGNTATVGNSVPATATDDGAIVFGNPDAAVTVDVYSDPMCPYCGQFERANGEDLTAAAQAGRIQLKIHPMAFLDRLSRGTEYSTRASNALVAVADADPEAGLRFYQSLYAAGTQPQENSSGLTDDELADLARKAGAAEEVAASIKDQHYTGWIKEVTDKAFAAGVTGTPTVKINGETFGGDLYTRGTMEQAITQAGA